jgi:hypothetical protein
MPHERYPDRAEILAALRDYQNFSPIGYTVHGVPREWRHAKLKKILITQIIDTKMNLLLGYFKVL